MNFPYKALKYYACAVAILAVAPAHATGGVGCFTTGGADISVSITLSRTPIPEAVGFAVFIDGQKHDDKVGEPPMHLAQSWFDDDQAMIDFVHAETLEPLMSLRTRTKELETNEGTLTYQDKTYEIRCEFE